MRKREREAAPLGELIGLYTDSAIIHGRSALKGDFRVGNKAHDVIAEVYRELRRRGLESQKALLVLLNHPEVSVRCWAAAHSLDFMSERGAPVLEEIVRLGGLIGLEAEMTLTEWHNGNLEFP